MGLKSTISTTTSTLLTTAFDVRTGNVVPTTDTVKLSDGAVRITAVFLYADLADSTGLAKNHPRETTAKVIRAYLNAVTRVIRNRSGEIRSFDGDRVMGIFIGDDAASRAARVALEIKWVIDNVVQPKVVSQFQSIKSSGWVMRNGTGVDISEALMVRGGVRNNSDLVSVGDAPNIAAKLSEYRSYRTYITDRLWDKMSYSTCYSSEKKSMWSAPRDLKMGDRTVAIRSSDWGWVVD
jgi:adenylate cyclase